MENKQIVRRYFETLTQGDFDATVALCAENLVNHSAIAEAQGAAGLRKILERTKDAVPDQTWAVEDVIAEGDRVVCRVKIRGTHTGPLQFTRFQIPATRKTFETEHVHVFRVEAGKIVEHWAGRDDLGVLRQIGVLPFAAAAKGRHA